MICCSAQIASVWGEPEKTLRKVEPLIMNASCAGASLIAFPEQFATGWDPVSHANVEDCTGRTVSNLQNLARKYSITIIGSFRERGNPLPRNVAVAVGKDGEVLAMYAKMHLFSPAHEDSAYTPGITLPVFSYEGVRWGMAICYDLRFPAMFRIYARQGVHAVLVPAAWPASRIRHWELFLSARAAENQMYIIGINTTGKNPVDQYSGATMTVDPYGTIVSRAGDREELLFSEIDPDLVDTVRAEFPIERDRKDALYHALLMGNS
jgi:predicted amidohydrolase